ncbi:MAG: glucuronate isomerase [Synergistaceae bacterium]|nr:glucuronate isomerase [Synergistaceae bacterium]
MKTFMDDNFLLPNWASERLYHDYAKDMPIFDYHSHLPVGQVADDAQFENITQVWLYADHYKWRAMRACGVSEELVSGIPVAAGDYERFEAWAKVVPQTVGNPLYHWSHLELKRYFGVNEILSPKTAREIYDHCNGLLARSEFSVRSIIRSSNVSIVCTTDDPIDGLEGHIALAKENWGCKVYPTWRPDKALAAGDEAALNSWIDKLEAASGKSISAYADFMDALQARHDFFHECGCRLSDYGMERPYSAPYTASEVENCFKKIRSRTSLADGELEQYRSSVLFDLLCMDARAGWTQQLHLGAKRSNSAKAFKLRGPDTGYDSIGQFDTGSALVALLDRLDSADLLARTVIYSLNPNDNDMLASIAGSFMDGKTPGKIQLGTAWWHNDHKDGINRQFSALSSIGIISRFVGMLTDSRSFLSYPRHEYFRRLLCAKLGTEMENGELPPDFDHIGGIVRDVCFNNAVNYLGMELP